MVDITRATILTQVQLYRPGTGGDNVRLERFRTHSEDCRDFHNVDNAIQIESLIVFISACICETRSADSIRAIRKFSRTQRSPNKHAI